MLQTALSRERVTALPPVFPAGQVTILAQKGFLQCPVIFFIFLCKYFIEIPATSEELSFSDAGVSHVKFAQCHVGILGYKRHEQKREKCAAALYPTISVWTCCGTPIVYP
jgi:hypothetical protein